MIFSYWRGSVNGACVTTGKVSSTGPALGCWPIWPAPNSAFCWLTALAMSVVVMPSEAMRSGFIQIRIAWSGDAHDLRLAGAGNALQRIEHVDVGVVGDVVGV